MTALRGRFQEEYYAHCHWNFLLAAAGDRLCAGVPVLPHSKAEDLAGPAPGAVGALCGDRRRGPVKHVDLGGGLPHHPAHPVSRAAWDLPVGGLLSGLAAVEVVLEAQGDQAVVDFCRGVPLFLF